MTRSKKVEGLGKGCGNGEGIAAALFEVFTSPGVYAG